MHLDTSVTEYSLRASNLNSCNTLPIGLCDRLILYPRG